MGHSKFSINEPKSGLDPEKLDALKGEIGEWIEKINELNGDKLEIKAEMALKNKYITPKQEKELFGFLNNEGEDLYGRYNKGEVTEDLLGQLKDFYEKVKNKKDEIFPGVGHLPKGGKADNPGAEFKGESSIYKKQARKFRDVRETGVMDTAGPGKILDKKIKKNPDKKVGGKETGGEDAEKIKTKIEEAVKNLYGFLNEGKEAPKEIYDRLNQAETELLGKVKYRSEVAGFTEGMKERYKKDDRKKEKGAKRNPRADQEKKADVKKEKPEHSAIKAEVTPEIREILAAALKDFSQQLKTEAEAMPGWNKYSEEAKKTLLRIDTETFLRDLIKNELVSRNLIAKEDVGGTVKDLMSEQ